MKKSYFLLIVIGAILVSAIILQIIGVGKNETSVEKIKKLEKVENDRGTVVDTPNPLSGEEAFFSSQALVVSPKQNEVISSPLNIQGNVVGTWFFEGLMPVKLFDSSDNLIASGQAKAEKDWMTEKPVPFSANLEFSTNATSGFLIISKDNPSGLPENDGSIKLPVRFK